jgi:hypothetical protein
MVLRKSLKYLPLDLRRYSAGDRNHSGMWVDPGDTTSGPDTGSGFPRQGPGAARDVQHALASLDASNIGHDLDPLAEQRRHEHRLIGLGCIDQGLRDWSYHLLPHLQ